MRFPWKLSLRLKLVLTFLGAVALALLLAWLSTALMLSLLARAGGSAYLQTIARQPQVRERARAVEQVLTAGGDAAALQQAAQFDSLPAGARTRVVDLGGTVRTDSGGAVGRVAAPAEIMRWLSMEQDSPPSLVLVEPIAGADGRGWGYYIYTQELSAPPPFRIAAGSPASRIAAGVMLGGQAFALVVSLLLFWAFGRHVVKPVARLSAVVGRLAGGELQARTGLGARSDELGALARDVDRMAERLQAAQEQAAAAEAARRFTVAAVAHDVRTPLTGILAHAEALRSGIADEPAQSLAVIEEKGLLIKELLDDLSDLAALDADRSRWQQTRLDVAELVRLEVAAALPELDQAGLEIAAEIPEEPVWADLPRGKLERVLDNLLANARKYGGSGGWLGVLVAAQGDTIRIEIADRGPGIPAAEQQRVFDRFYRAAASGSSRVGGSGLGLAVAREIVERLGGCIGVQSPPEGGARFWIELPGAGAATKRQENER